MPRDVTYHSARPSPSQKKLTKTHGLLIGLLLINVGVFVYHGDPRDQVQKQPAQPASGRAKKKVSLRAQDRDPSAPTTFDGSSLDVMAGVRTPGEVQRVETVKLGAGQTVAQALIAKGVAAADAQEAVESLKTLVDFRRLRAGSTMKARFDARGTLVSLDLIRSPADQVRASRAAVGFVAKAVDVEVTTLTEVVVGKVNSSLWEALTTAKEDPRLAMDISEVFAWDIDFYTEVQTGDEFRVLVDKKYVGERFIGYGPIQAAEYVASGVSHKAFYFETEQGGIKVSGYYDENGESLKKQLLKSPLKYAHVTSGFGSRKHPVLGYTRAHNGVDYGVPTGTPVWTVGDGRVMTAGWSGGYGKLVEVRHANGWLSQYAHLSQINVRVGQQVQQKDIVGLVGSTGMSTGPHLHYGLKKHGGYVDPQRQKFERSQPLAGDALRQFKDDVSRATESLTKRSLARDHHAGAASEG